MRVDVLIVGGGIAGASVGYFLAERQRVLLIEREAGFGYHSTGRSAAEWTAANCSGLKRSLALLSEPFLVDPPAGFAGRPLLVRRGNVVFAPPGAEAVGEAYFAETHAHSPRVRPMSASEARMLVPFLRAEVLARCYYDPDNGEIEVEALHQGYLRGIRERGGTTRAGVEFAGAEWTGSIWQVRLGDERIETPRIVDAAGAWADVVAARSGVAALPATPKRRTAISIDAGIDVRAVPVVDETESGFYFKGGGARLMVCPGDATPSTPCDAQPEDLDVATAVDYLERYTTLEVAKIASRWAGLRTFVRDGQPVAGFAPEAPGFFWLAGQGGAGILTSPGLGAVAAAIIEGWPLPEAAVALGLSAAALSPTRLGA